MRIILFTLFTLIAGFIAQQFLPWWMIAVIAGLLSYIFDLKTGVSFWAGFVAAALLWASYAGYLDYQNEGILSARIGKLFGGLPGAVLILLTGVVGGIFGGLGALTGSLGRRLTTKV
ncbi:MAG: hypothetical protein SFU99_23650 [Saprospiraceae bacterium]|nr:hypothetical protein [Saprospiraceae bacterium]